MAITLFGCAQTPEPAANYNIQRPIQTTADFLSGTRHYANQDINEKGFWFFFDSKRVKLTNGSGWQQLFALLPKGFDNASKEQLNYNLSRTCWSIKKDAVLTPVSQAHRGVKDINIIYACTSKRLGKDYPLFTVSYVTDALTKPYITVLSPTKHYSDSNYKCKAKYEGYEFRNKLMCL